MTQDQPASEQSLQVCVKTPEPRLLAKRVTRKNLAKVQERHLLRNIDPLMACLYPALIEKVKAGNITAISLVMQMANLVKAPGGVNISQTILQANSNTAEGGSAYSFESLARKLDKRDLDVRNGVVIDAIPDED